LFNHPNGENVYNQASIDYRGADVTPEKFLAVLKGDDGTAGGKVLRTGPNSKIFVNFSDHGAPGLIAFPNEYLYADDLQAAIDYMEVFGLYGEMTMYIEACESGSMFPNLRSDQHVYAVTASNATQSSWAAYCSPDDTVNGVHIGSCLGDLFSVNWMEDTEANNPLVETLDDQYRTVKNLTTASPVCKFGDFSFVNEPVADFEGNYDGASTSIEKLLKSGPRGAPSKANQSTLWDSRDVKMNYLHLQVQKNGDEQAQRALVEEMESRMKSDSIFRETFSHHNSNEMNVTPKNFDCLRFLMSTHDTFCGRFDDYSLKYVKHLVHTCETEGQEAVETYARKIMMTC